MRTYEISRGTLRAVQFAALELKLYALIERLERGSWLERRYAPDQPRVPAGNSDGGQWTDGDGGNGRQGSQPSSGQRLAQMSSQMGKLVTKLRYNVHHVTCIYDFGDALYGWESNMFDGCPAWIPQTLVVPFAGGTGSRINDN